MGCEALCVGESLWVSKGHGPQEMGGDSGEENLTSIFGGRHFFYGK